MFCSSLNTDVAPSSSTPTPVIVPITRVSPAGTALSQWTSEAPPGVPVGFEDAPAEAFALTKAESKVAEILLLGCTNPEIGKRLFVSRATVRTHVRHIFEKLGVHSRFEAISKLRSSIEP